ncbi:hypothetical protein XENTR_v10016479 [Xenopus tropicalis]|nr:uncharacterized protein LOC733507 isoform X1 [Xenopus tropicalis]XP_012820273.1 uncharacterized protein LOC733507 isoform X1 [Xenopus tropicalis]XP_031759272.1 uncharacterized protein LOC733507 isoform X1 [Xenopus tropicalis]KAE8597461.1 hypothetical protein XENTR_v10016479 [Xenopus tropicalis]KAE8597462.1 hypothetical protein XENTR_v10016479 [Xenopus tropicalis]KAE8597463.1 hypothetical protein XENTR_v10016479 [Xenopus tropicalis]KAE8597464.1 hypothetical protein XENTR_v10016479 [Xenopus |eukprot:XP_012820272.1 PREDICTED: uncharacterized protein LOC733507 isoform X1 [Xenopus tropicalis]
MAHHELKRTLFDLIKKRHQLKNREKNLKMSSNFVHGHRSACTHPPPKKKSKGKAKKKSLLEFIEDPLRKEPLIGLQYVVEVKLLGHNKSVYKCNLCSVRGDNSCIKDHLVGWQHLKAFMNKDHYYKIDELRHMKLSKVELQKILKEYAMRIEKKEGVKCVKVEYVHGKGKNNDIDVWKSKIYHDYIPDYQQKKITDRRQIALQYSENFKITSRTEANDVLNLTERLNKLLEAYFMKSGGDNLLHIQNTSNVHTRHSKHTKVKEDIACHSAREKDSGKSKVNSGSESRKRKASWTDDELPHSSSTFFYSDDSTNVSGHAQCYSAGDSTLQSSSFTEVSHSSFPLGNLRESKVYDQNTYSQSELPHTEAASVTPSVSDSVNLSLSYDHSVPADTDQTSSTSNLNEQPSETDATSSTSGKTSKTLSPDLLKLLKGKDLSTVIKILKTLAPFYPALQEVNIEMFAQVLLHAGALEEQPVDES